MQCNAAILTGFILNTLKPKIMAKTEMNDNWNPIAKRDEESRNKATNPAKAKEFRTLVFLRKKNPKTNTEYMATALRVEELAPVRKV